MGTRTLCFEHKDAHRTVDVQDLIIQVLITLFEVAEIQCLLLSTKKDGLSVLIYVDALNHLRLSCTLNFCIRLYALKSLSVASIYIVTNSTKQNKAE